MAEDWVDTGEHWRDGGEGRKEGGVSEILAILTKSNREFIQI